MSKIPRNEQKRRAIERGRESVLAAAEEKNNQLSEEIGRLKKKNKIIKDVYACPHCYTNPRLGQYGTCINCGLDEYTVKSTKQAFKQETGQ